MLNLEKDNLLYGTVVQQNMHANKYAKTFSKNVEGCRDGSAKKHTN